MEQHSGDHGDVRGDAEFYAFVKSAAEDLASVAFARDLGNEFSLRMWVDSTTANDRDKVRARQGAPHGVEEAFQRKFLDIRKVVGEKKNPADEYAPNGGEHGVLWRSRHADRDVANPRYCRCDGKEASLGGHDGRS